MPTPTTRDHKDGAECLNVPTNSLLGRVVWQAAWPTPTANNGTRAGTSGREGGMNLQTAAALAPWPTVTTIDNNQVAGEGAAADHPARGTTLGGAVRLVGWPSPCAQNATVNGYTDQEKVIARKAAGRQQNLQDVVILANQPIRITASGQVLTGSDAAMENSGQLDPAHSRWLMGFPPEWDACAVTAMPSSRKQRQNSLPVSSEPLKIPKARIKSGSFEYDAWVIKANK